MVQIILTEDILDSSEGRVRWVGGGGELRRFKRTWY
jgi:hypothetical protein